MTDNRAKKALKLMGIEDQIIYLLTSNGVNSDEWEAIKPLLESIKATTESLGEVVELFIVDLEHRHGVEEAVLAKVKHINRKTKAVTYTFDLCLNWTSVSGKSEDIPVMLSSDEKNLRKEISDESSFQPTHMSP